MRTHSLRESGGRHPPRSLKLERVGSQHQASNLSNFYSAGLSRTSRIQGLQAARIDSEIPRSKLQGSKPQGSRILRFYREALGVLSPRRIGDRRRAMESFGKTLSQPTSLQDPRNPQISGYPWIVDIRGLPPKLFSTQKESPSGFVTSK